MVDTEKNISADTVRSAMVVTQALLRASDRLGLSQQLLAKILGLSSASVSRFHRGKIVDPKRKEWELALTLLRIFRSLDTLVGGEAEATRQWFHAYNHHLAGVPAELVQEVRGLMDVSGYLDSMRGTL